MHTEKWFGFKFRASQRCGQTISFAVLLVVLNGAFVVAAPVQRLEPVASFTARLIGSINVLVGAEPHREGTAWKSTIFEIKEGTSDRTVLEFDLRGRSSTDSATLNLELTNLDVPNFTTIYLYSFEGNGLANAADYFRTDKLVASFTDNGLATNFVSPYHIPFSFDLTSVYNQAIAEGDDFLGLILKNTTAERLRARYRLTTFNGYPALTVAGIPEPSSRALAACVAPIIIATLIRRRPSPGMI